MPKILLYVVKSLVILNINHASTHLLHAIYARTYQRYYIMNNPLSQDGSHPSARWPHPHLNRNRAGERSSQEREQAREKLGVLLYGGRVNGTESVT